MGINNEGNRTTKIIYWVTTVLAATAFFVTGIGNLMPFAHIARDMSHLGYPRYFLTILGAWKMLGAVVILLPKVSRLREWAYAGMIFDLSGAAFSRAALGDGPVKVIVPIAIAGVVMISWALYRNARVAASA